MSISNPSTASPRRCVQGCGVGYREGDAALTGALRVRQSTGETGPSQAVIQTHSFRIKYPQTLNNPSQPQFSDAPSDLAASMATQQGSNGSGNLLDGPLVKRQKSGPGASADAAASAAGALQGAPAAASGNDQAGVQLVQSRLAQAELQPLASHAPAAPAVTPAPAPAAAPCTPVACACSEDKGCRQAMEDVWVVQPSALPSKSAGALALRCAGGRNVAVCAVGVGKMGLQGPPAPPPACPRSFIDSTIAGS
jgi:hypothetical protein